MKPAELDDVKRRVIVIGNSGSGKTTVANRIGHLLSIPVMGLDAFHWQGNSYGQKRDEQEDANWSSKQLPRRDGLLRAFSDGLLLSRLSGRRR